jgi:hypothetical protein
LLNRRGPSHEGPPFFSAITYPQPRLAIEHGNPLGKCRAAHAGQSPSRSSATGALLFSDRVCATLFQTAMKSGEGERRQGGETRQWPAQKTKQTEKVNDMAALVRVTTESFTDG